jgi:hypothetical protein
MDVKKKHPLNDLTTCERLKKFRKKEFEVGIALENFFN